MRTFVLSLLTAVASVGISAPAEARHYHDYPSRYHSGFHSGVTFISPPRYVVAPAYVYRPVPVPVYAVPQPISVSAPEVEEAADESYCREYQSSVTVGGVRQPTYGTACMQPDGSWRIMD